MESVTPGNLGMACLLKHSEVFEKIVGRWTDGVRALEHDNMRARKALLVGVVPGLHDNPAVFEVVGGPVDQAM